MFLSVFLFLVLPAQAILVASDNADNDPYPVSGFLPGDNGGFGFKPWTELETGTPGAMFTTASIDTDSYSWGIDGTYALGRELSNTLSVGNWTFLAVHDPDNTAFSGFNLKSSADTASFASDEILRVGMDPGQIGYDPSGIYVSTNAGASYEFFDCGWIDGEGDTIEYSIGWNTLAGTFSLLVSNRTEEVSSTFSGNLLSGSPVAMLGSGIFGNTTSETLAFDQYTVVPEPQAIVSLAFGAFGIATLRKLFML